MLQVNAAVHRLPRYMHRISVELADLEELLLNTDQLLDHEVALEQKASVAAYNSLPSSLGCFPPGHVVRQAAHKLLNSSPLLDTIVILTIVISCILAILQPPGIERPTWMGRWDQAALAVFTFELALKVLDLGLVMHAGAYLRSGWNLLDCFVVVIGYVDIILEAALSSPAALESLKALRLIRAVRPLRLIARAEGLRTCFDCLIASLPVGGQMSILLSFAAVAFGTVAVLLWRGKFHYCSTSGHWLADEATSWESGNLTVEVRDWLDCIGGAGKVWRSPPMNFDDVPTSLKTLFETATFSGYAGALTSAMIAKGYGLQPSPVLASSASAEACVFFFCWLVFGGFVVRPDFAWAIIPCMWHNAYTGRA